MNLLRIGLFFVLLLLQPIVDFPQFTAKARTKNTGPLPPDVTTTHSLFLPDRALQFTATAGAIRLFNSDDHKPRVDIAYVAYSRTNQDPRTRPVAFVFNGGPGYSSGWMHLGGLGPWRLPMRGAAARPSASPVVIENEETWLDFTDLVFIDPPGTGYGRILGDAEVLGRLWSVDGDIDALTESIQRWCEANDRLLSPKFLVGESYGGFRAPQIARKLQTEQGIGVSGMVLISPMLDFDKFWNSTSTMSLVGSLPSMAAVARGRSASPTRSDMRDVEDYASNAFILDLMKGPNDREAVDRLTHRVADVTGLEFSVVSKLRGRVPTTVFARELGRAEGKVSSLLDGSETGIDATPFDTSDDQIFNGLYAPVTEAMINLYHHQLNWVVEGSQYRFLNVRAHNLWDYGRGLPETITELTLDLALDPSMRVLVATGIFDLDIPYYGTKLMLDQIPIIGLNGRLQSHVYPAGHMIYARDDARKSLREDAQKLIENP